MSFVLNLILYVIGLIVYVGVFLFTACLILAVAVASYVHALTLPDRSDKKDHE